jgi:hypothetical protein
MRNLDTASRIVWNQGRRKIHADDSCGSGDVQHEIEIAEYGSMTEEDTGIGAFSGVEDMAWTSPHYRDEMCNAGTKVRPFQKNGREVCEWPQGNNGKRASLKRCDQRRMRR